MGNIDGVKVADNSIKINRESADMFFDEWADTMDIESDSSYMDEDDVKSFKKFKGTVVRGIMKGSLTFDDEGFAVYVAQQKESKKFGQAIRFGHRTGASMMAGDGVKKNHDTTRMYKVLADMCGCHAKDFAGMVGPDLNMCEAMFVLLMA